MKASESDYNAAADLRASVLFAYEIIRLRMSNSDGDWARYYPSWARPREETRR
jgi:hypothetical protein